MKRRGLSQIVSTVLLILIFIVSISIIYVMLNPLLQKPSDSVVVQSLSVYLEIVDGSVSIDEDQELINLNVRRNPGGGEIIDIKIILEDSSGMIYSTNTGFGINELQTKPLRDISYANSGLSDIAKIAIAPVFLINGKQRIGNIADEVSLTENNFASLPGPTNECKITSVQWLSFTLDGLKSVRNPINSADDGRVITLLAKGNEFCNGETVLFNVPGAKYQPAKAEFYGDEATAAWIPEQGNYQFTAELESNFSVSQTSSEINIVPEDPTCDYDYPDPRAYLYKDLDIDIFNRPDGRQTFTVHKSDNTPLRTVPGGETFYDIGTINDLPNMEYEIKKRCGGVDIIYTLQYDPSGENRIPNFQVEGIMLDMDKTNLLNTAQWGSYISLEGMNALDLTSTSSQFIIPANDRTHVGFVQYPLHGITGQSLGLTQFGALYYPSQQYSPVISSYDDNFAASTSFLYPYMERNHFIQTRFERLHSGSQAGTWRHRYVNPLIDWASGELPSNATAHPRDKIDPGERRIYVISLRFSQPQETNAIISLQPYKDYYNALYGVHSDIQKRDRRPILGLTASQRTSICAPSVDNYYPEGNPRGYTNRNIQEGWEVFLNDSIFPNMENEGYERIVFWNVGGWYFNLDTNYFDEMPKCSPDGTRPFGSINRPNSSYYPSDYIFHGCNMPSQFMTGWLPELVNSQDALTAFEDRGYDLGFWWGRSSQIPVDSSGNIIYDGTWNPAACPYADYNNSDHIDFLKGELTLALQRGADLIGLDAFVYMNTSDRYRWTMDLKRLAPNVTFIHEVAGPDFMTSIIGNFYNGGSHGVSEGPPLLEQYLNPQTEIWVQLEQRFGDSTYENIQNLVKWGFTPVVFDSSVDLHPLDFTMPTCFDSIDNDDDNLTDFYDPDCTDTRTNSELND